MAEDKVLSATVIIAIANAVAPSLEQLNIPDATERSRLQLVTFLKRDFSTSRCDLLQRYGNATYNTARADGGMLHGIAWLPATIAECNAIPDDQPVTTREAVQILGWLVTIGATHFLRIKPVLYATFLISLVKQGNITEDKLNRITDELEKGIGHPLTIEHDSISAVYTSVGRKIPVEALPEAFRVWEKDFTGVNLRMRLTIMQAAGTGLTAINTIKKALHQFPGFDWAKVCQLLPGEAAAIIAAFEAIGDDQYYGFRLDLTNIASAKYRSFAYVAKELLIRYGGPEVASLKNYAGWTRYPRYKAIFDTMIKEFTVMEDVPVTQADEELLAKLKGASDAAHGVVV